MKLNLPPKVRAGLYVVTAVGTPAVAYALVKGWIGEAEVAFWSAEVTVVSILAAFNTNTNK